MEDYPCARHFNPTHQAELTNEPTPELLEPRPTPELQEVPDAKVPVAPPVVAPVKVPSPKKGPSPRRVATPRKVATPRRVATPKRAASPVKAPVVTPVEPVNLKVESLGITWRCGKLAGSWEGSCAFIHGSWMYGLCPNPRNPRKVTVCNLGVVWGTGTVEGDQLAETGVYDVNMG